MSADGDGGGREPDGGESEPREGRLRRAGARVAERARRVEQSPKALVAAKLLREVLPGDSEYGDPLSTAGSKRSQALGRWLLALTEQWTGLLREM